MEVTKATLRTPPAPRAHHPEPDIEVLPEEPAAEEMATAVTAAAEPTVTDARGRVLTLRKPPFLAQFDVMEALGPELSANQPYMAGVMAALCVAKIDGKPVPVPRTKLLVRSLLSTLGDDGYVAIGEGIKMHFGEKLPGDEIDLVKNS